MADLTKDQLRQQNQSLFANNNSGNITAEDLRTFNDEMIDTIATEFNPSFTGSVEVEGDVSASTYYGDGSNLTGVTSEVPSGTVSSSQQIVDYNIFATTGSNNFVGVQTINGEISKFGGDYIDYVGGNIETFGGRVAGTNMGNQDGSSNHTGSFSGDGSGLTNLPSGSTDISQLNLFTQSQEIYNSGINSYTQSTDVTIGNIETYVTSSSQRIDLIEDFTGSQETLNSTFATTGSNTFTGDQVIEGTNLIAGNTLVVKDGDGSDRLLIRNKISGDSTGEDLRFVGDSIFQGTMSVTSNLETNSLSVNILEASSNGFISIIVPTKQNSNAEITGSLKINGDLSITNNSEIEVELGSSVNFYEDGNTLNTSAVRFHSGSDSTGTKWINIQPEPGGEGRLAIASFPENNHFMFFDPKDSQPDTQRLYIESIIEGGDRGGVVRIGQGLEVTGSLTNNGDTTIVGTNTGPGNTFTAKDGNGTARLQVNNATLKGFTNIDVLVNGNSKLDGTVTIDDATTINGNLENTGSFTNGGDTTIIGTNAAPSQTFIAKDGTGTNRLEVNNATLKGFTGVDVNINGKTQITDTLTLQGDEVVNGTNAAPGATLDVKDGTGTSKLQVQNAALKALTGVDVVINGETLIGNGLQLPGIGNYANDGDAAAGGVPINGVYHHNGALKIRTV